MSLQESELCVRVQRSASLLSAILCLLGGALVIYGMVFLPMFFCNRVNSDDVTNFALNYTSSWQPFAVVLTFPILSVLFVVGTSAASFVRELSPKMVTDRRIAALEGLTSIGLPGGGTC